MGTAWPNVKNWLVTTIPTLPDLSDVAVSDGPPVGRAAPKRYVSVGFVEDDNAGTYSREPAYDGSVWSETGDVRARIVAQSGTPDGSAQGDAFEIVEAIHEAIVADTTLGGALSEDSAVHVAVDVLSIANARGAATELVLTLTYTTTT
jgi:hypothetical protein